MKTQGGLQFLTFVISSYLDWQFILVMSNLFNEQFKSKEGVSFVFLLFLPSTYFLSEILFHYWSTDAPLVLWLLLYTNLYLQLWVAVADSDLHKMVACSSQSITGFVLGWLQLRFAQAGCVLVQLFSKAFLVQLGLLWLLLYLYLSSMM